MIPARTDGRPTCIAVDVMGSDMGPLELLEGVFLALRTGEPNNFRLIVVGDEQIVRPVLMQRRFRPFEDRLDFQHAGEVIAMDEKPMQCLRQKKDASMARAVELVKAGKADGALSCGNTGCLVALSTIQLRPLSPAGRPALATIIPAIDHNFILLDAGANPIPLPIHLTQSALLGSHYCRIALGIASPRVGLLSIGTEEGKGNEVVQKTHEALKNVRHLINYVGLIEGFQLFENQVDVVVCDGFVGNILLKSLESIAKKLKGFLRRELFKNPFRIFGCLFASGALRTIRKKLSAEKYGGAPLLGLNGSVFKAHGSSNRQAICHAILIANRFSRENFDTSILHAMNEISALFSDEKSPVDPADDEGNL